MMSMAEFEESDYEVEYMTATEEEKGATRNGHVRARNPPGLDMREYSTPIRDTDPNDLGGDVDFREHHPLLSEGGIFSPK